MRRVGGTRHNISERVIFHVGDRIIAGWALNLSRGGLRAIVEEPMDVGAEIDVVIGDGTLRRAARVVWIRDKRGDGAIVGVSFVGANAPPPATPSDDERTHET